MRIRLFVLLSIIKCVIGKFEGFIVGGHEATNIEQFPHVAYLLLSSIDSDFHCGSSILNQFILVTAAHCVSDDIKNITATVGSVNKLEGKRYLVQYTKMHPYWNEIRVLNDVALCKLTHQLIFGRTVKRVILMKHPPYPEKGRIAGWGAIDEVDYNFPKRLKYTDQKLWDYNKCRTVLKGRVPQGTFCGGEKRAKTKFCSKGDSGSGLLVRNTIIVGLVSFKYIKVSRSLVVYTNVTYHYNWIKGTAEKLAQHCLR